MKQQKISSSSSFYLLTKTDRHELNLYNVTRHPLIKTETYKLYAKSKETVTIAVFYPISVLVSRIDEIHNNFFFDSSGSYIYRPTSRICKHDAHLSNRLRWNLTREQYFTFAYFSVFFIQFNRFFMWQLGCRIIS
jgi:hypothetical protein